MGKRLHEIDALRGVALVGMIVFHFFFDLDYFGIVANEMYEGWWLVLARFGQFLFLGLAGVSVALSSRGFGGQMRRSLKIFLAGMAVSFATWIFAEDAFVKFGVLHFIAVAIPIAYFFKGRSMFLTLAAAILVFDLGLTFDEVTVESPFLFPFGLTYRGFASLDYFPIFPWLSAVLVGLVVGRLYLKNVNLKMREVPILCRMGRHSLWIYLLHQPILIALILLVPIAPIPVQGGAFLQVCEQGENAQGPWNGDLVLSSGGEQDIFVKSGGVPTIIQDSKGRLIAAFQWFPCDNPAAFDKVAVKISEDGGLTWSEPEPVKIKGLPETYKRPFDPTLALTEDGKIRMYFTSSANLSARLDSSVKTYSAISEDGVNYTFERGVRFEVEGFAANDAAAAYFNGLWYLITPKNLAAPRGAYFATSEDGLTFTRADDIILSPAVNWTGNFFATGDALYFYGTPGWYTKTTDGKKWAPPVYLKDNFGSDPAVFCRGANDCLVIATKVAI